MRGLAMSGAMTSLSRFRLEFASDWDGGRYSRGTVHPDASLGSTRSRALGFAVQRFRRKTGAESEPSAKDIRDWVKRADRDEMRRPEGLISAEQEVRRLRRGEPGARCLPQHLGSPPTVGARYQGRAGECGERLNNHR
jgi:hypothetical protein